MAQRGNRAQLPGAGHQTSDSGSGPSGQLRGWTQVAPGRWEAVGGPDTGRGSPMWQAIIVVDSDPPRPGYVWSWSLLRWRFRMDDYQGAGSGHERTLALCQSALEACVEELLMVDELGAPLAAPTNGEPTVTAAAIASSGSAPTASPSPAPAPAPLAPAQAQAPSGPPESVGSIPAATSIESLSAALERAESAAAPAPATDERPAEVDVDDLEPAPSLPRARVEPIQPTTVAPEPAGSARAALQPPMPPPPPPPAPPIDLVDEDPLADLFPLPPTQAGTGAKQGDVTVLPEAWRI